MSFGPLGLSYAYEKPLYVQKPEGDKRNKQKTELAC
jgi:hypothetical protein